MILVLDHLQWVDDAGIALCRRLAGLIGQLPLLLVLVRGPVPQRARVEAMSNLAGVDEGAFALKELSPADVTSRAEAATVRCVRPSY